MSLCVRRLLSSLLLSASALTATAQAPAAVPQADRVAASPDLRATTRLPGHVPAWAAAANDAGAVPDDTPLRLTFVPSRSLPSTGSPTRPSIR